MPRVSIGLPVRNGENYLVAALDSICSQTFRDFDVLISDNGSDDRTELIARSYAANDPRICYIRHEANLGAAANFNYVFRHTTGDLFHWAAHDDMLAPDFLEKCVAAFDKSPDDVVLVYPQTLLIDASGTALRIYKEATRKGGTNPAERLENLIGPGDYSKSLLHMCFPVFGLIRRSALRCTSLIANFPRSDTLLLVELALLGPFIELGDALFLRREHPKGSVIAAENAARKWTDIEKLLAAWFDPKRGAVFPATYTRLGAGYVCAVLRTPMAFRTRIVATSKVMRWLFTMKRTILHEAFLVVRDTVFPSSA